MIQEPSELVRDIRMASDLASKWEPEHPQYIEGRFYLTPEQWEAVCDEWPVHPGFNGARALWGLPVHIIKPNDRIRLPSGSWLVYSEALQTMYTFGASIAAMAGLDHE